MDPDCRNFGPSGLVRNSRHALLGVRDSLVGPVCGKDRKGTRLAAAYCPLRGLRGNGTDADSRTCSCAPVSSPIISHSRAAAASLIRPLSQSCPITSARPASTSPSTGRIFTGFLVARRIGTPNRYETWMPSHIFHELYRKSCLGNRSTT